MYFLIFILLLLLLLVLMLFIESAVITLQYNTNQNKLYLLVNWFNLFKADVQVVNNIPILTIYLFGAKIYSKAIKKKTASKKNMKRISEYYRSLALNGTYANIYYGFNSPFSTGITSGIIKILQFYFKNITIEQFPDFIPDNEYIQIDAGTELNIGKTFAKMLNSKVKGA